MDATRQAGFILENCFSAAFRVGEFIRFVFHCCALPTNSRLGFFLITFLISRGQALMVQTGSFLRRYPRRVTALVTALMLGGGGGALALASLAPEVSDLPVRQVVEPVDVSLVSAPVTATPLNLFRSEISRNSDTADTLLKRLGIDDAQAASFLRHDTLTRQLLLGRGGRQLTASPVVTHCTLEPRRQRPVQTPDHRTYAAWF